MATAGTPRQGSCEGCDFTDVSYFCDTCPVYLCSRCGESHKRYNATKSHLLQTIDVIEAPRSSEPVPAYCPVHPADQLTSYCNTCDLNVLCTHCHWSSHSNHTVKPIDQSKNKIQNLSKLFDSMTTLKTDDTVATALKDKHIAGLQEVKNELLERKTELQACIETSYTNSVIEVDAEISRVQRGYDKFMSQKKESMTQTKQLDAKPVCVRRHDDVDFQVDAFRECKLVHPNGQRMAGFTAESLITLQSRDEVGKAKSTVVNVLSVTKPDTNKTVTDTISQPVAQKMRPMLFHTTHDKNMQLSANRRQASRVNWLNFGICFGDRPVVINEKIYINITNMHTCKHFGKSSVGFTSHDPNTLDGTTLPGYARILGTEKPGFWVADLPKKFRMNSTFYIYVTSTGTVRYGVNGVEKRGLLYGVNTDVPIWLILDISGRIFSMTFVGEK